MLLALAYTDKKTMNVQKLHTHLINPHTISGVSWVKWFWNVCVLAHTNTHCTLCQHSYMYVNKHCLLLMCATDVCYWCVFLMCVHTTHIDAHWYVLTHYNNTNQCVLAHRAKQTFVLGNFISSSMSLSLSSIGMFWLSGWKTWPTVSHSFFSVFVQFCYMCSTCVEDTLKDLPLAKTKLLLLSIGLLFC